MIFGPRRWLRRIDGARIEQAIAAAERLTSGEIRVSVAPLFWGNVERAARLAFERLGMQQTHERNGVLIFVVPARRRFFVLGDTGIHEKVGQRLWDEVAAALQGHFTKGEFTEGLVAAVERVGRALAEHFPHRPGDVNELPNRVDFGKPPD